MTASGFPHSDTLGSQLCWQLPQAYRGLTRPSSAPGTKASTICPTQLQHKVKVHKTLQLRKLQKTETTQSVSLDARVHYAHLNQQPTTTPAVHTRPEQPLRYANKMVISPKTQTTIRRILTGGVACFFRIQQGVVCYQLQLARKKLAAPSHFSMRARKRALLGV